MTSVFSGTFATFQRLVAVPTKTSRCAAIPCCARRCATCESTKAPNENPASISGSCAQAGCARICSITVSKSSCSPSLCPTPRKFARNIRYPSRTKARVSVWTTLLSIVPPNNGCGCATSPIPCLGASVSPTAISIFPAGPSSRYFSVCVFTPEPDWRNHSLRNQELLLWLARNPFWRSAVPAPGLSGFRILIFCSQWRFLCSARALHGSKTKILSLQRIKGNFFFNFLDHFRDLLLPHFFRLSLQTGDLSL